MGVTGGTPLGFDVGAKREGGTLPGLDLGVRGMRQGGQRKLLVPPNLVCSIRQGLVCSSMDSVHDCSTSGVLCRPMAPRARARSLPTPRLSLTWCAWQPAHDCSTLVLLLMSC